MINFASSFTTFLYKGSKLFGLFILFSVYTPITNTQESDIQNTTELPSMYDINDYPSIVGDKQNGWYGAFSEQMEANQPSLFIPRCSVPAGASIYDFDTDARGRAPRFSFDHPIRVTSHPVQYAPFGTISPNNALHLTYESPENFHSLVAFRQAQNFVGLYVGDISAGGSIELIAYNSRSQIVGVDRIAQAQRSITTCMAIKPRAGETIQSVAIVGAGDIYIDRLFYSNVVEINQPPRPATGRVEFIQPQDAEQVNINSRLLVTGKIYVPKGLELTEALITLPNWDRSQTITKTVSLGKLWDEDDESLYIFTIHGLYLPEGESYLSLTATGHGVIASNFIVVNGEGIAPLHDEANLVGKVDIEPVTIEVTQAVRGQVPIIPPGSTIEEADDTILVKNKPTVVRGFAHLRFPDGEAYAGSASIGASLVGSRSGVALPGSPLAPRNSTSDLAVFRDAAEAYLTNKQENGSSWVFALPESWTQQGSIDLRLEVNPRGNAAYLPEHPSVNASDNIIGINNVKFREQQWPGVVVWLVDYYYRCLGMDADGNVIVRAGQGASKKFAEVECSGLPANTIVHSKPTAWDAAEALVAWWNMAPIPQIFPSSFEVYDYVFVAAEDLEIPESAVTTPFLSAGSPANTDTLGVAFRSDVIVGTDGYGIFNVLMSDFVRGKAWGSPSFIRVTTNKTTTAHEAAHSMGMLHTGDGHEESFWLKRWSGDHGEIARTSNDVSLFDVFNMNALGYTNRHDYMSYGPNRWSAWDTWHHVEDAVGSNMGRPDVRLDDFFGVVFDELFGLGAPADNSEVLTITGTFDGSALSIQKAFHLPGATLEKQAELQFKVIDNANDEEFVSYAKLLQSTNSDSENSSFSAAIYVPKSADELVVLFNNKEVYRSSIVTLSNSINVNAPTDWPKTGMVDISWTAPPIHASSSATSELPLTYLVQVSKDLDQWYTIAQTNTEHVQLDAENMPFSGPGWQIRVQGSTGLGLAISSTVLANFPQRFITPFIVFPRPGQKVSENSFVNLQAISSRFSEGLENLQWWVGGEQVARGTSAKIITGEPGNLNVVLRSPDTGEEASVNLKVMKDKDLDGMEDDWETLWGLDPQDPSDKSIDGDQDGLIALDEFLAGSSPNEIDTDGDRYTDATEYEAGSDPNDAKLIPSVWMEGQIPPMLDIDIDIVEEPKDGYSQWIFVFLVLIVAVFFILFVLKSR